MTMAAAPVPQRCTISQYGDATGWHAAIVIPAKDEAGRIISCLDAAARAIAAATNADAVAGADAGTMRTGIVVVVNNTTDGTAGLVAGWALAHSTALTLIDCDFRRDDAGVGSARRIGLDHAVQMLGPDGVLLTTDADTHVRPDWVVQNLAELAGADLICGAVLGQDVEARALPAAIAAHGSAEWDYVTACIALAAALDPQPHDPSPAHHNAAGASLACTCAVYTAVGGLPVVQMGEDRAFAERVAAHDFRLRYSDRAIVETSCRMVGRTEGGMAGALRARATEADPLADEWLEAADEFVRRYALRGKVRAVWPRHNGLHGVLAACFDPVVADLLLAGPWPRHCGSFIARIDAALPPPVRLRLSGCRQELPRLQAHLRQILADRSRPQADIAWPDLSRAATG